jgi:hypothetical protein
LIRATHQDDCGTWTRLRQDPMGLVLVCTNVPFAHLGRVHPTLHTLRR